LREWRRPMPRILTLSAKYGLIEADTRIQDYDFRMTPATAEELRPAVLKRLCKVVGAGPIRSVGLCLGRDYKQTVEGLEGQLLEGVTVEFIEGGLGLRLTRLREWLYRAGPKNDAKNRERGGKTRANDADRE
jgi:hypothetical protein